MPLTEPQPPPTPERPLPRSLHSSPAGKDSVVNCSCPQRAPDTEFYISCDFCREWYHGTCTKINDQMADRIHIWACPMCSKFGKVTSWWANCAAFGCSKTARNIVSELGVKRKLAGKASKFCSDECGVNANRAHAASITKTIPKKPKPPPPVPDYQTIPALDSEHPPETDYDYEDVTHFYAQIPAKKEALQSRIRDVEARLLALDDLIDKMHWMNLDKAPSDIVCGFDERVIYEWTRPGFAQIRESMTNGADSEPGQLSPTQCATTVKCPRHHGWQKVKLREAEIELECLVIFTLQLTKKQIKEYKDLGKGVFISNQSI